MTKTERKARAKRNAAKTRKARAVKEFLRKMNPASKRKIGAVRVKRLAGGGISLTPIKVKRTT